MEYIVHGSKNQIDSNFFFSYFGAIYLKRMRRFDLLTTDLDHALVVSRSKRRIRFKEIAPK